MNKKIEISIKNEIPEIEKVCESVLDYISSAGLRVLLQAAKKLNQICGTLILYSVKDEVKKVFDVAGLSPIFPTYIDQEDAINNIK